MVFSPDTKLVDDDDDIGDGSPRGSFIRTPSSSPRNDTYATRGVESPTAQNQQPTEGQMNQQTNSTLVDERGTPKQAGNPPQAQPFGAGSSSQQLEERPFTMGGRPQQQQPTSPRVKFPSTPLTVMEDVEVVARGQLCTAFLEQLETFKHLASSTAPKRASITRSAGGLEYSDSRQHYEASLRKTQEEAIARERIAMKEAARELKPLLDAKKHEVAAQFMVMLCKDLY